MSFCECGTLLSMATKTGELKFQCPQCRNEYNSTPDDALIYRTGNSYSDINPNVIKLAPHIKSMPKVEKKCPKCPNTIVTFTRTKTGRLLYICGCGNYWS